MIIIPAPVKPEKPSKFEIIAASIAAIFFYTIFLPFTLIMIMIVGCWGVGFHFICGIEKRVIKWSKK